MTASCGAELLLQIGKGARVIDVRVAVDHDLDVFGLEPELANGLDDHRAGRRHARVHQDVAFGRREQEDAEPLGADEIEGPDDLDRLGGLFPLERLACEREEELVVVGELLLGRQIGRLSLRQRSTGGGYDERRDETCQG